MRINLSKLLAVVSVAFWLGGGQLAAEERIGSRFAYLDESDPYYPHPDFPKLTTPMWVGEEGVEAVILLSVDDMGGPPFRPRYDVTPEAFERFLAPLIERLKKIDGRAPISVMTCQMPPNSPTVRRLLKQGLSFECHTYTHRFPFFRSNEGHGPDEALEFARMDYLACMENLFEAPGNGPVAHRMPGCDAQNSVSPRFYTEVFPLRTSDGRFLTCDSSIMTWFPSDETLPSDCRIDSDGRPRFDKYVENIPQTRHFVNSIRNYPYPYVINNLVWELPVTIPCDSHGVHQNKPQSPKTTDDWKRAVDVCVRRQGLCNLLFHTIGYCENEQLVAVIDYADRTYGRRVKFLNCREIYDRLTQNVLGGVPLRSATGGDNGARLLDVNADGFLDVAIGNSSQQTTRIWDPSRQKWREVPLPVKLVDAQSDRGRIREKSEGRPNVREAGNEDVQHPISQGVRFLTASRDGHAGLAIANERHRGVWRFASEGWEPVEVSLPAQVDGKPLNIVAQGKDRGVRFRDLNGDGISDLIVNNESQNVVFLWDDRLPGWQRAPFALPDTGCLVDGRGIDQGLRFVDVDSDADDDLILSNDREYQVRLFTNPREGWWLETRRGCPGDADALPMIVRDGKLNGVWFHSGAMVLANEHTVENKDFITRIAFGQLRNGGRRTAAATKITVTFDRGRDVGQNFGSLFEASSDDGSLVVGAGFQNLYNTRYRADRHAIQFFLRPGGGERTFETEALPRPNTLCGTYLYGRDGVVRSTYGGVKAWDSVAKKWQDEKNIGGTEETMRVGNGLLEFGDSTVKYNSKVILSPPEKGSYQLFFYANGHLCFYHVNRGEGGYRPYRNDSDGFSKLYACPWTTDEASVDLSKAILLTLPVVGETTFAWGQLGEQIVTGSNIGGFYVFEDGSWRMLLEPKLGVSYQLYSTMAFHDRLLMGQYPSGRVFEYDGQNIVDLAGWPPKLAGVSGSAREAQTTVVYGGDLFVGVWPWGELWRYNPDSKKWTFMRRMFDHPELRDNVIHPYDVENRGNAVGNLWGQRVTSLVTSGPDLFISTSAKYPCEWNADQFPFLAPKKWKSYGSVYRMTMPGHLSATTNWTNGPTTIEFTIRGADIEISQDGKLLAAATLTGLLAERLGTMSELKHARWGDGIYGKFRGMAIEGTVTRQ